MSETSDTNWPGIREYMRQRNTVAAPYAVPKPVTGSWEQEVAKQLRLANLIQWAGITNNHKGYAAEIEEGLRT